MKIKKMRYKILIAILLGIINSLVLTLFIKNTTLYSGGTSAFFLGVGRFTRTYLNIHGGATPEQINIIYNLIYWGGYLLMNIPLFVVGYKHIGKNFAILSLCFVVSDRCSGFLYGLLGDNFVLDIFGTTTGMNTYISSHYGLDVVYFNPNIFTANNDLDWTGVWTKNIVAENIDSRNLDAVEAIRSGNNVRVISLFFYSLVFSSSSAFITSILFVIGGSTAGSDFITVYYSVKKHKDLGLMYGIINALFMISGYLIGSYMSGAFIWNDISHNHSELLDSTLKNGNQLLDINNLFSANIVISLVTLFISGAFISKLFPSKKLVKCEVSSNKNIEIDELIFNTDNFPKIIPIKRAVAAKQHTLRFICSYLAYPQIYQEIRKIDKDALILTDFVSDIDGPIDLYKNNFGN